MRSRLAVIPVLCLLLGGACDLPFVRKGDPGLSPADSAALDSVRAADSARTADSAKAAAADLPDSLSAASQLIIRACDNYLEVNPSGENIPKVMSIKASVFYNNRLFEQSRKIYKGLVDNFPGNAYAIDAIRWTAQSFYEEKRFDEAQQWYRKLRDVAAEGGDKEEAIARIAESIYRLGEHHEKSQQYEDAADQYKRVALEFPESKIADVALFNAGQCYERMTEWSHAILMYQRLLNSYATSKLVAKARFRIGRSQEKMMQWEEAAQTYLRLVANHLHSEFAPTALRNAGFCFENAQKFAEAAATFEKMAQLFPKSEDAADVLFMAGEFYGKVKDWDGVSRVNAQFSKRFGGDKDRIVQALCMVGVALFMQEKTTSAIQQLQKALATYRTLKNPSTINSFYAAKAQFTLAEIKREAFRAVKLALPKKVYNRRLKQKSLLLDRAVDMYSKVIAFGISEWITRSIAQIGQAYEEFAMDIFQQQRPPSRSVDQQLMLELGIARAVEEYFVEKALYYHEQNILLGIKENIENEYILESRKKLTYLPYIAGENYLALAKIARSVQDNAPEKGFAAIAAKLGVLQKIAPFQERAIDLFLKCLEIGTKYEEYDEFFKKASDSITVITMTVGKTYMEVANIARSAPIPPEFNRYERFVYKTKLLKQIQSYQDKALENLLKAAKIAEAYNLQDDAVAETRGALAQLLFTRGRCYDLLALELVEAPPFPPSVSAEEKEEYLARFSEVAIHFQDEAINTYTAAMEYAESGYVAGPFLTHAYVRLYQLDPQSWGAEREKLVDRTLTSGPQWKCAADPVDGWYKLDFDDSAWRKAAKGIPPDSLEPDGFPGKIPTPMWYNSRSSSVPPQVYFRRTFYTSDVAVNPVLVLCAIDRFRVYINGKELPADSLKTAWYQARRWDLSGMMRNGKNVLAIEATNTVRRGYGVYPHLSLSVPEKEYVPEPPGAGKPWTIEQASYESYRFPEIENFEISRPASQISGKEPSQ